MQIRELVASISGMADCRVLSASGQPSVVCEDHVLPSEIREFYSYCGGVELFMMKTFGFRIVAPLRVLPANPILLRRAYLTNPSEFDTDISSAWYIIAEGINSNQYITIDFSKAREGWCYDSFWDVYATRDSRIVAKHFSDLIESLIGARGEYLFWEKQGFHLGYAYEGI